MGLFLLFGLVASSAVAADVSGDRFFLKEFALSFFNVKKFFIPPYYRP